MVSEGQKKILYVDDDADDREFFSEAIKDGNPSTNIVFAENGLEALDYLNSVLNTRSNLPCLIVLDLNMPLLDGKETFQRIKRNERLQNVPIVIFTSSNKPADKDLFNSHGIEFITKPTNFQFMKNIANHMLNHCP